MTQIPSGPCAGDARIVLPCSGAADVGEIADRAGRMIHRDGSGKMCCLAAVAGRCEETLEALRAAERVLALDGCENDCVKKTLEHAGFTHYCHLRVTDLGMQKGRTPVTVDRVRLVAQHGTGLLRAGRAEHLV